MKVKNDIVIEEREGYEWVYLYQYYQAEKNVAEKLIQLDKYKNIKKISKFEKELEFTEAKSNIDFQKNKKKLLNR